MNNNKIQKQWFKFTKPNDSLTGWFREVTQLGKNLTIEIETFDNKHYLFNVTQGIKQIFRDAVKEGLKYGSEIKLTYTGTNSANKEGKNAFKNFKLETGNNRLYQTGIEKIPQDKLTDTFE